MLGTSDPARDDRLRRNRISAKKCRNKRKLHVNSLEEKVDTLSMENSQLLRENERLAALVARLQSGQGTQVELDARVQKRAKHENGATYSFDSSESADGEISSGYGDHPSVLGNCSSVDHDRACESNT